jgi:hypothetical protein
VKKKPRKRLSDACHTYGLDGWERIDKEDISKAIGDGTWRGRYSPQEVVNYCEEDVRMEAQLLRAQLRPLRDPCGRIMFPAADAHPLIASGIIETHRRTYPRFWQWRDEMVLSAMLNRRIESVFGWPLQITASPNRRAIYNFPMQSGGAEMLRLAACRLCEAGIVPCMLIHDGILIEAGSPEQVELAKEIMRSAGRDTCNGLEIGVDVDQTLVGGARYCDKRPVAKKMWETIIRTLEAVKAIPRDKRAA